ncbi:hypothetical protein BST61_g11408 [Cercospora zeina]
MPRTQGQGRRMAPPNGRHSPAAVTVDKCRGQAIPLKGNQFLRRDPYDIPEEGDGEFPVLPRDPNPSKTRLATDGDPDDSPLSENELEAVYGQNASPISSSPLSALLSCKGTANQEQTPTRDARPKRRRILQLDARDSEVFRLQADGNAVARSPTTPTRRHPNERVSLPTTKGNKTEYRKHVHLPLSGRRPSVAHAATREAVKAKASTTAEVSTHSKHRSAIGRLPSNELLLVKCPAEAGFTPDPLGSSPDPDTQDPIETCFPGRLERNTGADHVKKSPYKAPLTSIRKRIKTPRSCHKSIVALRKKQDARAPFFKSMKRQSASGDGFEPSELKITHSKRVVRQRRGRQALAMGFATLSVKPGPLPAVEFKQEVVTSEIKPEGGEDQSTGGTALENGDSTSDPQHLTEKAQHRTVTFSDRVLDPIISQRLAAITAPKRAYSISSDESEDEYEEHADWNQSEAETLYEDDQTHEKSGNKWPSAVATPPSNQRALEYVTHFDRSSPCHLSYQARSTGVQFDFRKSPVTSTSRTPFDKRHLIEVDDMIMDEPDTDFIFPPCDWDNHDVEEPKEPVLAHIDQGTPFPSKPPAPRSILRRKSSMEKRINTRTENTAANTRRNSMRASEQSHYFNVQLTESEESKHDSEQPREPMQRRRNTEINLDESRYFKQAANRLQQHSTDRPRIIKQRSSEARRASWLSQQEVLIADSDAAVLESTDVHEAFPEPPDYTNFSKRNVVVRNADNIWTSSNVPRMYRDLKTLTRTVSREHGTLSQSVRRKSSLMFRSPTKIK